MSAQRGQLWGYHELDSQWARRLVAGAHIEPGELVLDVGAGTGALTSELLSAGARVIAVELNPGRAALLRDRFASSAVKVVQADASDLRLPRRPFKVVSNPPFAITMALVKRLVANGSRLERADLVVPAHLGRRWTSRGAPGSGRWSERYEIGIGRAPPARAFRPPPPGGVSLLVIERRVSLADPVRARRGPAR